MRSLLAELDLVCRRCDALSPPGAASCPSCAAPFEEPAQGPALTPLLERLESFTHLAELVLLRGAADQGTVLRIPPEGARIGREEGEYRFPGDPTLAPLAASFSYMEGRLRVRDEGGASGVYLSISEQASLGPGETFAIGDHLLRHGGILAPPRAPAAQPIQGGPFPEGAPLLRLETLLVGGGVGRVRLLPFPIRIGRREGELLLREDRFVSARHCALYWDGEKVLLEDLKSSNGTFLRLPPGQWLPLRRGDTLRLGRNILRLK